ncbi:MAG: DUF3320 domain-containing protein [Chlorobiaceae bacterium]
MSNEVIKKLEASRKELLDVGLRNPLINHQLRAKQVKLADELSTEIYRMLVLEGNEMSFDGLPEKEIDSESGQVTLFDAVDQNDLQAQPVYEELAEGQLAARHLDRKLQTSLSSQKLQTRLLSIHNDARSYIEEQGVNILFLVLGFLHWYEDDSSKEARRAPLLLIPVELKRASAQERFQLYYTGDDIGDNLSLIEKLKGEFNILLPRITDAEEFAVQAYFDSVAQAVASEKRWSVVSNDMTLGFFSFGKFLMYKDLDPAAWTGENKGNGYSIIESLLIEGFREQASAYGDETHIDAVISPADIHQVKDADSTQILAILDVNSGRNLVLQGPPGTGKSQTITNIIAECIGNGRKVLFVSEKMAALDVVKRRLDEVWLGDAVLELHSHKTNKKKVLAELDRTRRQGKPVIENPAQDIITLTRLRDELNAYCEAVNKPRGKTQISFINALGFALKNHPGDLDLPAFEFEPMAEWSESDYRAARMQVETLDRHLSEAGPPTRNPFESSGLTEILPSQQPKLERALNDGRVATEALLSSAIDLAKAMGLQKPEYRSETGIICRAARRAMEAPHIEGLALTSGDWQVRRDDISALISAGKALSIVHASYDDWLIDHAWSSDLVEPRQHFMTKGKKWWRFLSTDYRKARQTMQGYCRKPLPKDSSEIIQMVDAILDSQKHQKLFSEHSDLGATLFGAQWKKGESDWEVLEKLTEWVVALYRDMGNGVVPESIVNFLSGSPKVDELKEKVEDVESNMQKHEQNVAVVEDMLKLKLSETARIHWDLTLEKQGICLDHWCENLDRLFHLIRFNQLAAEMTTLGLGFIVTAAKSWGHGEGTLIRMFKYSWYNGLVEKAYIDAPVIKSFDRIQHTHVQEEFIRLDHLLFRHNQSRLATEHWKSIPSLDGGGELQIISSEINKKRRQMPIRVLMSKAGRAIQAIKPVFMMSPMSIATYVPPGSVQFDLVIFDEASQVKPVDAFGAIMRGKQSVVVGDSKQLPPTSFFDTLVESDEDEEFDNIGDTESILSLFLGKGAPERMLRWHYRSRHDSLIAVSNNEFYDNRLVVFPSPGANAKARGLKFHHLPNTAYDRGKTRSNPEEARVVAKAILEHAKSFPDLTLGVVTFSTAQRDAVELQLELLRRADASCEPFFNEHQREPFFVKNLENVQGDERDIIFISIGYGKTAEGYMAMNFGALNKDGGERRLNVLISRARLAMDVFCNFTSHDIDLSKTSARGTSALKNFLAFAQSGILPQPYSTGKEPDSPFEEEVIRALKQRGIEIEPQVGTAGFFIDIGIKSKERAGQYILGIECDGATYHSSRSARDRDRLRQEVLQGLGWQLHRIWSTDWYRNPVQELERALIAIEKAESSDKNGQECIAPQIIPIEKILPIDREEVVQQGVLFQSATVLYRRTQLQIPLHQKELHEFLPEELLPYLCEIIKIESPIHTAELTRSITEGAGLKRAGVRIQGAVFTSISYGVQKKLIVKKGEFCWHPDMSEPAVRDRSELDASLKKFEWVSPEEIRLAIFQQVKKGFTLTLDESVANASRALGFQRVTAQAKYLFELQLDGLIQSGALVLRNGFVSTG